MQLNGEKVIERMKNRGVTVQALSEQTGIARNTISRIRAGRPCHRYTAEVIAGALGADIKELREENKRAE